MAIRLLPTQVITLLASARAASFIFVGNRLIAIIISSFNNILLYVDA
jgi:hypothetical protein